MFGYLLPGPQTSNQQASLTTSRIGEGFFVPFTK
jgi:hypothetical protein